MRKYVSDVVGDGFKTWSAEKPVVIHAPTGTGKTHFILNVLLPYVYSQGKMLVYMANRTALKQQVENSIPVEYSKSIILCSYQQYESLPGVYGMEDKLNLSEDEKLSYRIAGADYYILDEAHFFLSDSTFFEKMSNCIARIDSIRRLRRTDAVWVYMTATLPYLAIHLENNLNDTHVLSLPSTIRLDDFMPRGYLCPIDNMEVSSLLLNRNLTREATSRIYRWMQQVQKARMELITAMNDEGEADKRFASQVDWYKYDQESSDALPPMTDALYNDYYSQKQTRIKIERTLKENSRYYFIEEDFTYLDVAYFDDWDEVISCIKKNMEDTSFEDKWLIFVRNEKTGNELIDGLHNQKINEVAFITAKSKKNGGIIERQAYKNIIENDTFNLNVLIATKIFDNGINLKDSSLKHIVIDFFEETTFLQMLGRKRRQNCEEKVELFLRNISEGSVRKFFRGDVLRPIKFWQELMFFKSPDRPKLGGKKLHNFYKYYTNGAHFKKGYEPLIAQDSDIKNHGIKKDDYEYAMVDLYQPARYVQKKIAYEFDETMAMFEEMQEERTSLFADFIYDCIENKYDAKDLKEFGLTKKQVEWVADEIRLMTFLNKCTGISFNSDEILQIIKKELIWVDSKAPEIEPFLQSVQYMWIRKQLSWIGFNEEEYAPWISKNWALEKYGFTSYYKEQFVISLECVVSPDSGVCFLASDEQKKIKNDFCAWIQSVRPVHRYSKSRGSILVINTCMREFDIPYQIMSKKKSINGKQRNWWVVLRRSEGQ